MQVTATINVVPAGLSEQDRLIVTTAIKLLSIDGLNYKIYDNAIATAHLLILDEESNDSKAAMRRARAGQVKLIISSKPTMAKNSIGLQRPMELGNLKGLLKNLYEKFNHNYSTSNNANKSISRLLLQSSRQLFLTFCLKLKPRSASCTC